MPKTSNPIWDYFKVKEDDISKAVCILCKKNLSRGSKEPHKMTTTNLLNHLKGVHNAVHNKMKFMISNAKFSNEAVENQKYLTDFCTTKVAQEVEKCDDPEPSGNSRPIGESSNMSAPETSVYYE